MQTRLQAAPQSEQLFAEVERRLELFADMEQRLLAQNEERLGALLKATSAQLSQQLSELRSLRGEMMGQVDALSKVNAKTEDRGWFR